MSVLIKGMEMPRNCFECPWRCKVDPENLLCRISGEYFEETFSGTIQNRHKSCPLVPVPPHGDLIDRREAIIDANERAYDFWLSDDEVNATIQFLKEQPTIIPAEEVKES